MMIRSRPRENTGGGGQGDIKERVVAKEEIEASGDMARSHTSI
jgi:hypothetical protein